MTDERPRPRYGEYAPTPPATAQPVVEPSAPEPIAAEAAAPAQRPRRTWDLVLTTTLLLFGVLDVVSFSVRAGALGTGLAQSFDQMGLGEFTSYAAADAASAWIIPARAAVLAATVLVSLLLIARRRLSFWVPLVGAVIAMIVLVVGLSSVISGDPAFLESVATRG